MIPTHLKGRLRLLQGIFQSLMMQITKNPIKINPIATKQYFQSYTASRGHDSYLFSKPFPKLVGQNNSINLPKKKNRIS